MRNEAKRNGINNKGQSSIQFILPLIILFFILSIFAVLLPRLTMLQTIGLGVGTAIFILSFISTDFALYILIFSMLLSPEFNIGTTQGATLGRGVTLRMDDIILLIIGFSWLAKMSINKDLGLFLRTPLNKPIAYYIIICMIATLFGSVFGKVHLKTGLLFVLKYFEYMIIYFMVVNHLKNYRQMTYFLWAMLITCIIVSVIAIMQIPGGGRVTAPFEGASGEPNTFGGYLVFMVSIVIGLFLTTPSFRNRLIYGILIFLFFIPLLYTQSRSSYLAAVPAILAFLWLSEKRNWVLAGLILISISLPFTAPKPAKDRITYTFTQGKNRTDVMEIRGVKLDTSTTARVNSWKDASKDWMKHPLIGHGVTGYRFVDAQYIRIITETGFLGLVTYFFLMATIFRQTYEIFKSSSAHFQRGLSMGFLAAFIGLLFHAIGANTFIIVRIMEPFWFITAMVILLPDLKMESRGIGGVDYS
ncbi:MAG: O-antigen ligase family protein [Deltaproteobacteria bacterium]|nr:O-antigen ligase family protein [Deltaproteobacteria bacterium]